MLIKQVNAIIVFPRYVHSINIMYTELQLYYYSTDNQIRKYNL